MTGLLCAFPECELSAVTKFLCDGHYQQRKNQNPLRPLQKRGPNCSVEGCDKPYEAKGYCWKHYGRWRAGKDPLASSRKDPSIIEEDKGHLVVHLGGKWAEQEGGAVALISLEDHDLVHGRSWWMTADGYVETKIEGTGISLHRLLLRLRTGDPRQGDHIDGNPLNNQRDNLRIVTFEQNMQNKKTWGKSGHRNIYQHPRTKVYRVLVRKDGKLHSGGRHKYLKDAKVAAKALRAKLFTHHNESRT